MQSHNHWIESEQLLVVWSISVLYHQSSRARNAKFFNNLYRIFICIGKYSEWTQFGYRNCRNYPIRLLQVVASAPHASEHTKKDFKASDEFDVPKDVAKIFKCGFQYVDHELEGKKELLAVWSEYKPFLEFLNSKVEACIKQHGESEAKR